MVWSGSALMLKIFYTVYSYILATWIITHCYYGVCAYITYPNSVVRSVDHSVGSSNSSMKANSMVCDRDTPPKSKLGM